MPPFVIPPLVKFTLGVLGGAVLCVLPATRTFGLFYPTLILYCALFTPTLALGNSLSLHHLRDAKHDFPQVKVLSAIGWHTLGGEPASEMPAPD